MTVSRSRPQCYVNLHHNAPIYTRRYLAECTFAVQLVAFGVSAASGHCSSLLCSCQMLLVRRLLLLKLMLRDLGEVLQP